MRQDEIAPRLMPGVYDTIGLVVNFFTILRIRYACERSYEWETNKLKAGVSG
ncbi:MAG: hypothetical protein P9X24_02925 [Candidatus Hatepunaea meridiana]|nr:hypothetical protein [Candidatus Hatepunaea meridiana]